MITFERFAYQTRSHGEPIEGTEDNLVLSGLPITKVNRQTEFTSHGVVCVAVAHHYLDLDEQLSQKAMTAWREATGGERPRLDQAAFRAFKISRPWPNFDPVNGWILTGEQGEGDSQSILLLNHDFSLEWKPKDSRNPFVSGTVTTTFPQEPARAKRVVHSSLIELHKFDRLVGCKRVQLPAFGTGYLGRNNKSAIKPVVEVFFEELSQVGIHNAFANPKEVEYTYTVKVLSAKGQPTIEIPSSARFPQYYEELNRRFGKPTFRRCHKLALVEGTDEAKAA